MIIELLPGMRLADPYEFKSFYAVKEYKAIYYGHDVIVTKGSEADKVLKAACTYSTSSSIQSGDTDMDFAKPEHLIRTNCTEKVETNLELTDFNKATADIDYLNGLAKQLSQSVKISEPVLNELQNKVAELISRRAIDIGKLTAAAPVTKSKGK